MLVAITGKSGSGKSTAARAFAVAGFYHIDVDKLVHGILNTMKDELLAKYGPQILLSTGKINRVVLGDLIFSDRSKYIELVTRTWELATPIIDKLIRENKNVVIEHILVQQTRYWREADLRVLALVEDDQERIRRIMERDNVSAEYLQKREAATPDFSNVVADQIVRNVNEIHNLVWSVSQRLKEDEPERTAGLASKAMRT